MTELTNGYRALGVLLMLSADRFLSLGAVSAALLLAAYCLPV